VQLEVLRELAKAEITWVNPLCTEQDYYFPSDSARGVLFLYYGTKLRRANPVGFRPQEGTQKSQA
jgi:hypothetical protein